MLELLFSDRILVLLWNTILAFTSLTLLRLPTISHELLNGRLSLHRFRFLAPGIIGRFDSLLSLARGSDLFKLEVKLLLEQLGGNAVLGHLRILDLNEDHLVAFVSGEVFY